MTLALRLQSLMRRRGIRSQSQLARLSGVSQASIHRILCGAHRRTPSLDVLSRLATAMDESPAWLIHDEAPTQTRSNMALARPSQDAGEQEWRDIYRHLASKEKRAVLAMARLLVDTPPA